MQASRYFVRLVVPIYTPVVPQCPYLQGRSGALILILYRIIVIFCRVENVVGPDHRRDSDAENIALRVWLCIRKNRKSEKVVLYTAQGSSIGCPSQEFCDVGVPVYNSAQFILQDVEDRQLRITAENISFTTLTTCTVRYSFNFALSGAGMIFLVFAIYFIISCALQSRSKSWRYFSVGVGKSFLQLVMFIDYSEYQTTRNWADQSTSSSPEKRFPYRYWYYQILNENSVAGFIAGNWHS